MHSWLWNSHKTHEDVSPITQRLLRLRHASQGRSGLTLTADSDARDPTGDVATASGDCDDWETAFCIVYAPLANACSSQAAGLQLYPRSCSANAENFCRQPEALLDDEGTRLRYADWWSIAFCKLAASEKLWPGQLDGPGPAISPMAEGTPADQSIRGSAGRSVSDGSSLRGAVVGGLSNAND